MALFGNFKNVFKKANFPTNYLSLVLTSNEILATVWELEDDNLQFIGNSKKKFHSIDDLVKAAAAAIDEAAQKAKTDVTDVVFGLSHYWLEDGKLTKETSTILKKLSQNLELDAKAFVPIASSINHFLKIKEGKSPALILIGVYHDFTEVHLITQNKVENSKIYKGEATTEKITELLKQIQIEINKPLPAVVNFIGIEKNSELVKEFFKKDILSIFEKKPEVEVIEDNNLVQSVAYSQAADILGHDPLPESAAETISPQEDSEQEISQEIKKQTKEISEEESLDNFGFIPGQDILESQKQNIAESVSEAEKTEENKPIRSEDYAVEVENLKSPESHYESPQEKIKESEKSKKRSLLDNFMTLSYLSKITELFTAKKSIKNIGIFFCILAVIGFLAAFAISQTLQSAQILLKVNSKPLENDFSATVANGASIDPARSRIPGEEVSAVVSDSQQTNTTGSKKTGTNAKGEIQVLNWTTSQVTFDQGTVVISKNGVKFQLDNQVSVASRSASLPGQVNVNVTAQDFGTQGNVDSGVDFTFQKYDELLYSAKSNNAFAGGDEKQITIVSQDDQTKLQKSLLDSLTTKAKSALREKLTGQNLNDEAINIVVTKKQFDKDVDQEASQLKLDMEVTAKALMYNDQDLKNLLSQQTQNSQDPNLETNANNIDLLNVNVKVSNSSLLLSGRYRANLLPKINQDDLKTKIAGKSTKEARAIILQNVPQTTDVEFKFSPNLIIFSQIPKNPAKISFQIEAIK